MLMLRNVPFAAQKRKVGTVLIQLSFLYMTWISAFVCVCVRVCVCVCMCVCCSYGHLVTEPCYTLYAKHFIYAMESDVVSFQTPITSRGIDVVLRTVAPSFVVVAVVADVGVLLCRPRFKVFVIKMRSRRLARPL